jgi:hypothetical protein
MVHVFRARRAGLGFATFFWKVAKKRNPNNPETNGWVSRNRAEG